MEQNIQKRHSLHISDNAVVLTGVDAVENYDDKSVFIKLSKGTVALAGTGFSIEKLDIESGKLELAGTLIGLKYGVKKEKKGFLKRLIK